MTFKVLSNPTHSKILGKLRRQHTSGHRAGCTAQPAPFLFQSNLPALPLQPSLSSEIPVWHPLPPSKPLSSLYSFQFPQPRSDRAPGESAGPHLLQQQARAAGMCLNSHQHHQGSAPRQQRALSELLPRAEAREQIVLLCLKHTKNNL